MNCKVRYIKELPESRCTLPKGHKGYHEAVAPGGNKFEWLGDHTRIKSPESAR